MNYPNWYAKVNVRIVWAVCSILMLVMSYIGILVVLLIWHNQAFQKLLISVDLQLLQITVMLYSNKQYFCLFHTWYISFLSWNWEFLSTGGCRTYSYWKGTLHQRTWLGKCKYMGKVAIIILIFLIMLVSKWCPFCADQCCYTTWFCSCWWTDASYGCRWQCGMLNISCVTVTIFFLYNNYIPRACFIHFCSINIDWYLGS